MQKSSVEVGQWIWPRKKKLSLKCEVGLEKSLSVGDIMISSMK